MKERSLFFIFAVSAFLINPAAQEESGVFKQLADIFGHSIASLMEKHLDTFADHPGNQNNPVRRLNDFKYPPPHEPEVDTSAPLFVILPKFRPEKLVSFAQYILLCACGIYTALFAFRDTRVTIIIFGFFISYFFLAFTVVQLDIYKAFVLEYQFLLFFVCVAMGITCSVLTNLFRLAEQLVVGFTLATAVSLVSAQFYVDFNDLSAWAQFFCLYILMGLAFARTYYYFDKPMLAFVGSITGSTVMAIYTGVMQNHIESFEDELQYRPQKLHVLSLYICFIVFLTLASLVMQWLLHKMSEPTLKDYSNDDFSEISAWS